MQQVRVSARIKRKPTRYEVSVVTRDEVGAYKPYLWEQSVFEKGPMFRYNKILFSTKYKNKTFYQSPSHKKPLSKTPFSFFYSSVDDFS